MKPLPDIFFSEVCTAFIVQISVPVESLVLLTQLTGEVEFKTD